MIPRMRKLAPVVVLVPLLLGACAHTPAPVHNPLAQWVPSPNVDVRRPVIIVLHATERLDVALDVLILGGYSASADSLLIAPSAGVRYAFGAETARR